MNKILSVSEAVEPPLFMLSLAVVSLVFNLCFPQYSAYASANKGQKFVREEGLKEKVIALNNAKEAKIRKIAENSQKSAAVKKTQKETYSQLKLEPKQTAKRANGKVLAAKIASTSTAAQTQDFIKSKWVTVTAYSSTVDQCDSTPFITASGTHVRDGIIATNLLAFGTKVKFPGIYGDKIFTVEDRMNQRYSNRADIWFETREEAKKFGVKTLEMIIVS